MTQNETSGPTGRVQSGIANLFPGYFALVMGDGDRVDREPIGGAALAGLW